MSVLPHTVSWQSSQIANYKKKFAVNPNSIKKNHVEHYQRIDEHVINILELFLFQASLKLTKAFTFFSKITDHCHTHSGPFKGYDCIYGFRFLSLWILAHFDDCRPVKRPDLLAYRECQGVIQIAPADIVRKENREKEIQDVFSVPSLPSPFTRNSGQCHPGKSQIKVKLKSSWIVSPEIALLSASFSDQ